VPLRVLLTVFIVLLALTFTTVAATWSTFGSWALAIALGIATLKASLVALYFMHLAMTTLDAVVLLTALLFLAIFLSLTLLDTFQYQPEVENWRQASVPHSSIRASAGSAVPCFPILPGCGCRHLLLKYRYRHNRYDLRGTAEWRCANAVTTLLVGGFFHVVGTAFTVARHSGACGATAATASPVLPEPIATRQPVFAIPSASNGRQSGQTAGRGAIARLHDRGARWQLYARCYRRSSTSCFTPAATASTGLPFAPSTIRANAARDDCRAGVARAGRYQATANETDREPKGSVAIAINRRRQQLQGWRWPTGAGSDDLRLPPGERPRMVNSRLFSWNTTWTRLVRRHRAGRVVGHPRRRKDLAELHREQRPP